MADGESQFNCQEKSQRAGAESSSWFSCEGDPLLLCKKAQSRYYVGLGL